MSDRKRLLSNMASLFTLQGANYVLPLVTLPYLVRVLGPEKFGLIAFAQAFIQYFVVATDYGFNLSATRDVAVHRDDPEKLGEIVSAVMSIKVTLFFAGALLLSLLVAFIPTFHTHWALYLIVYLTVMGATLFPTWLFQGLERMRDITWMNMGTRLLTTAAIFIFIHDPQDYLIAAGIQSVPVLLAVVPAWLVLRRRTKLLWRIPPMISIVEQIKNGYHLFLSTIGVNIYTTSNIVILGLVSGPSAVGFFSPVYKIVLAIFGILTPITQTLYPHISVLARDSRTDAISFIDKIIKPVALIGILTSFSLYIFSDSIVHIIFGPKYIPSIAILKAFSLIPFAVAVSNILGTLTMLPLGMSKSFTKILLISAILNITFVIPFSYFAGGVGTAFAMVLTEYFVTISMWVALRANGVRFRLARSTI